MHTAPHGLGPAAERWRPPQSPHPGAARVLGGSRPSGRRLRALAAAALLLGTAQQLPAQTMPFIPIVSPDGVPVTVTYSVNVNGYDFTVQSAYGTAGTMNLSIACTGVATACSLSTYSVPLSSTAPATVRASYKVTGLGIGRLTVRGWNASNSTQFDNGWIDLTVNPAPGSISAVPQNGDNRRVGLCVANCFDAAMLYATPAYTSLDVPRAVSLVYRSSQARPMPTVEVDVTDNSTAIARYSLLVKRADGAVLTFTNGSTEIFRQAVVGTNRLAAQLDGATMATGSYTYTAVVRRWFTDGTMTEATAPVSVLVVNEKDSPFGWGWSVAGLQRLYGGRTAPVITEGDGSAVYFRLTACVDTNGDTQIDRCDYARPAGEFSTLTHYLRYDRLGAVTDRWYERVHPDGSRVTFAETGRMTDVRDRFGNATSYGYDAAGRPSTITDPAGMQISFGYGADGKLDWIRDPSGRYTYVTIDAAYDLTVIQDPAGYYALRASYDGAHRMATRYDRRDGRWDYTYDFAGKLAADAAPAVTADGTWMQPTTRFASWEAAVLVDPASGLGTAASPAPPLLAANARARVIRPRGNATAYAIDRWGAATQVEDALGNPATSIRDDSARLVRTTTALGETTEYSWSGPNRTKDSSLTTGRTVSFGYGAYGLVTAVRGHTAESVNFLSPDGRRIDSSKVVGIPNVKATTYTYDTRGRLLATIDPEGHATRYYYGATGWQNTDSVVSASGAKRTAAWYDGYGRVIARRDPWGYIDSIYYDPLNRVTRTVGKRGDVTTYVHDGLYLTSVTDAKGQVYEYQRNALGWVEVRTSPGTHPDVERRRDRYAYDANGNVTSQRNRRLQTVSYSYDQLDRKLTVVADGQTTSYGYDPRGRWLAGQNGESIDTVSVDAMGRRSGEISRRADRRYTAMFLYRDPYPELSHVSVAGSGLSSGGSAQSHSYTDALLTYSDGVAFSYNGDRNAKSANFSGDLLNTGALTLTTTYTPSHQVNEIAYNHAAVSAELGRTYEFDAPQRLSGFSRTWNDTTRTYSYDAAGQLSGYQDVVRTLMGGECWTDPWTGDYYCNPTYWNTEVVRQEAYTYDPAGNRTDRGGYSEAGNRLTSFDGYSLTYDEDGNLVRKYKPGIIDQSLRWNSLGQLVSVTTNGATTTFGYDAFGRRVRKSAPTGTRRYVLAADNVMVETDDVGNVLAKYQYYPGVDSPNQLTLADGTTYRFGTEMPGSVAGIVRSSDYALLASYRYTPWGELTDSTGSFPNTRRFNAREFDPETGLYYFRARYYDPTVGRFISEDPLGLDGGINAYVYANNDPINQYDPTGALSWKSFWKGLRRIAPVIAFAAIATAEVLSGGTLTVALLTAGKVMGATALGSAVAAGAEAAVSGGSFMDRFERNFGISSLFLAGAVIFSPALGGYVGAGAKYPWQGYVATNNGRGALTLGSSVVFAGVSPGDPLTEFGKKLLTTFAEHEFGHTMQFVLLSIGGKNPWVPYLGLGFFGMLGEHKIPGFGWACAWEKLATYMSGPGEFAGCVP